MGKFKEPFAIEVGESGYLVIEEPDDVPPTMLDSIMEFINNRSDKKSIKKITKNNG